MTVHRIWLPDSARGGEPRMIDWDADAGTVVGDHSRIDALRERIDHIVANDGVVRAISCRWDLRSPWHDPADFLVALHDTVTHLCWNPAGLPPALRDVMPTQPVAGRLPTGTVA